MMRSKILRYLARALIVITPFLSEAHADTRTCRADFSDETYVTDAGVRRLSCEQENCAIFDIVHGAGRRFEMNLDRVAAGQRLWIRYQSQSGFRLAAKQGATDTDARLDPSADSRWEPLPLTPDGANTTLKASLAKGDLIECVVTAPAEGPSPDIARSVEIDKVWSGSRVSFGVIHVRDTTYVAYYDAGRQLSVASVEDRTGIIRRKRLPITYTGWDTHNYISLAMDSSGYLHVSGNMHASPLVYFVSSRPADVTSLTRATMIGTEEKRVTYPTFLSLADARLLFLYRDGVAGDGAWFVNVLEHGRWRRLLDRPLFAGTDANGPVSAYPSEFTPFPDGSVHVVVMWRRPGDVARNFSITHHKTYDFASWQRADGKIDALPLGPDTGDLIDNPGENAGLLNTHHLAVSPSGKAAVTYTKYARDGRNGFYLATPARQDWRIELLFVASQRFMIDNVGIARGAPGVAAAQFPMQGAPFVQIGFPGLRYRLQVDLDAETLKPRGAPRPVQHPVSPRLFGPPDEQIAVPSLMLVNAREGLRPTSSWLMWWSQGQNGDKPWACATDMPKACDPPPNILRLITLR
jgi:hypothetical protein